MQNPNYLDSHHFSEGACYVHQDARWTGALSLFRVAHSLLLQTTVISLLDEMDHCLQLEQFPNIPLHHLMMQRDPGFLDAFRIVTAFENVFKAELLLDGYVVHDFDNRCESTQELAAQQKSQPVAIDQLTRLFPTEWVGATPFKLHGVKRTTIGIDRIISQSAYRGRLGIDVAFQTALSAEKDARNSVHFLINDTPHTNLTVAHQTRLLVDQFNRRLANRYPTLLGIYEHWQNDPSLVLSPISTGPLRNC